MIKANFSKKVNKIVPHPFSWYVNKKLYPHSFSDDKPICFLFFALPYIINSPYLDFLRKSYCNARYVLFYQDLVDTKNIDIYEMKRKMDLVLSYDRGDCLKYNLLYHPTPMSRVNVPANLKISQSDIYFCGFAKNRYETIRWAYRRCEDLGLKCDFNIVGVWQGGETPGINYHKKPLTYFENLQHVVKTKCVIEIMQMGADGFTPRLWESIMFDRHLLTNNGSVEGFDLFTDDAMHGIKDLEDGSILSWINKKVSFRRDVKDSLSPVELLHFIDERLN